LKKWGFLTVFQGAKKPLQRALKCLIQRLIQGSKMRNLASGFEHEWQRREDLLEKGSLDGF
jgi:hypothetical protein